MARTARFSLPGIVGLLLFAHPGGAALLGVTTTQDELNSDGDCSLREAIEAANTDAPVDACGAGSGADQISVPAGTYQLTIPGASEDNNATGDLDVLGSTEIFSVSKNRPSIVAPPNDRVFHLAPSGSGLVFELVHLRISGGDSPGNGGGVWIDVGSADARIDDCEIVGNSAAFIGGGISHDAGSATVTDSLVENNTAQFLAGGIFYGGPGTMLVEDSRVQGNLDMGLGYPSVGGGGGLYSNGPLLHLRRSVVLSNHSAADGGGLATGPASIHGSLIENTTFSGNSSDHTAGAILCGYSGSAGCNMDIDSSTITANSAVDGGGLFFDGSSPQYTLRNSIVAQNTASGTAPDIGGAYTSLGHNLVGNADGSTPNAVASDLSGTTGSEVDPELGPLAYNGYPLPAHRPVLSSPAVESGSTDLAEDQRGEVRLALGADDRGAIELRAFGPGYYLDLGTGANTPSAAYGAAATTPGAWQVITAGNTALLDTTGAATGASVNVQSGLDHTSGIFVGPADPPRLFGDKIYDCGSPAQWSIDFSNLPDGPYLIYIYAPADVNSSTGAFNLDGLAFPSLPGDSPTLIEFETYRAQYVTVTGGALALDGEIAFASDCAGVAGLQLLPEPQRLPGLSCSALALFALGRLRRGFRSARSSAAIG